MNKTGTATQVFLLLLIPGTLLGDGKQSVIDAYGVATVLVCWAINLLGKKKTSPLLLGSKLQLPWIIIVIAFFISALFSLSPGLSTSALVRLLAGFLIYRVFVENSNETTTQTFFNGLMVLTYFAGALFVLSSLFPTIHEMLPKMNLFDVRFGHSHLAELLVIVAPYVVHKIFDENKITTKKLLFAGTFFTLLIATLSRGLWVLVGGYGVWFLFHRETQRKRSFYFVVGCFVCLVAAGVLLWPKVVLRQGSVLSRIEYWRQAGEATKERPIFGMGPGTFSLASLRFRANESSSSWFAHGFFIQTLSEVGVVGLLATLWLFAVQISIVIHSKNSSYTHRLLKHTAAILLIYSVYEYALDYFVVWLLFWASVGLLVGLARPLIAQERSRSCFEQFVVIMLIIFYGTSMASSVFLLSGNKRGAFYLAPYDGLAALAFFEGAKKTLRPIDYYLASSFHPQSPTMLASIGKSYELTGDKGASFFYYGLAREADPKNEEYHEKYTKAFFSLHSPELITTYIQQTCQKLIQGQTTDCLIRLAPLEKQLVYAAMSEYPANSQQQSFPQSFQKSLYLAGLSLVKDAPKTTQKLWMVARHIQPTWGYYHVELAALQYHVFGNYADAQLTLEQCTRFPYAKNWCEELKKDVQKIPGVGDQKKNIISIPKILPY